MRRMIFLLIVAILLAGTTTAIVAADPNCQDGRLPSGALYRICLPEKWNGRLVVFAPGYVSPREALAIPEEQLVLPDGTDIPELVTGLGYAFAVTSYRQTGLAVLEGLEDVKELVQKFAEMLGQPQFVYLAGVSEGGLIAALAAEQANGVFDGALSCCAAIGDFPRQINYWGDVRVIFDYFFPSVLPPSPIQIPDVLMTNYSLYITAVVSALTSDSHATDQLLAVTRVPPGPTMETRIRAVTDNLWYNVFATNDAIEKLNGQPYDNSRRWYTGSDNDLLLNLRVARFRADRSALREMQKYQTSGRLRLPLVTLHNTQDHVVPYWHELLYGAKVLAQGSLGRFLHLPVNRWGHCNFQPGEVLAAFGLLTLKVEGLPLGGAQTALPHPQQERYRSLLQEYRQRW